MASLPSPRRARSSSGPFAPDDSTTMFGTMTSRLSDGNPVIILGYFFADGSDSYDFCALLH
jgi:hypothetical protein